MITGAVYVLARECLPLAGGGSAARARSVRAWLQLSWANPDGGLFYWGREVNDRRGKLYRIGLTYNWEERESRRPRAKLFPFLQQF